jgi:uncharacterized protein
LSHSRTCIVTRQVLPADELIRFVAGPDGQVVPDLARKLPGRGVWVTAQRQFVERALSGRHFARGLRENAQPPADLPGQVDVLLEKRALSTLALCRKAGVVVTGFDQVDSALRSGKAIVLLHAAEARPDGVRKLAQAVHAGSSTQQGAEVAVKQIWSIAQMGLALGGENVVHAAAIRSGVARKLIDQIVELERYRG